MDNLVPLLLYFVCTTLCISLTTLAVSFDNISTAATAAVTKLDPQNGIAPSSHVVLVTCVKYLYTAQYPVRWTAQSALHLSSPGRHVHSDTNSASPGSILAMQQLRNDYSLTCPPLSIARYSFIQLSRLRRREENENAQASKR